MCRWKTEKEKRKKVKLKQKIPSMRTAASTQDIRDTNLVFSFTFTFLFFSSYPNVLYHFISMMILLNFHFILYLSLSFFFVLFSVSPRDHDFIHPDPLHLLPPLSLQHLKRAKFCPIHFSTSNLAFLFWTCYAVGEFPTSMKYVMTACWLKTKQITEKWIVKGIRITIRILKLER